MTVRELIEKLKDMDQDAEVYVPAEISADRRDVEKAGEPVACWTAALHDGRPRRALLAAGREEWDGMCEIDADRNSRTLPPDGVLL